MKIQLNQVIPQPLKENFQNASDIWQKHTSFEKGKKYLVTAPSGKGKSTFLHIIYGLRNDYEGKVNIDNQDVKEFQLNDWANVRQSHLSIIFQNLRLFPQLTGLENIKINNKLQQTKTVEQIKQMADQLGVSSILQQRANTMSYGQRQRIAIIRALCQPFSFLLLDEPFSHLDQHNIQLACELIKEEVQHQNAGMIFVSLGEKYFLEFDEEVIL